MDQHKQHLTKIIESELSTTEEKYDALVALAYMTGVLTHEAGLLSGSDC
jgi:hypothetical protein